MKFLNAELELLHGAAEDNQRDLHPAQTAAPRADELARLRGWGDRRNRHDASILAVADDQYEPVSFTHPESGRRVYGYLVAAEANGDARIDLGDDTYAIVPKDEIRRIGDRQDRDWIRANLKNALPQFSSDEDGVRADLRVAGALVPVGDDFTTSIAYSTTSGRPAVSDLLKFAEKQWPDYEISDIDEAFPGRVGVILRPVEAADGVVGGEVLETLDPEDVIEERKTAAPLNTQRSTSEWVDSILHGMDSNPSLEKLAASAVNHYLANGGTSALLRSGSKVDIKQLLRAAIPMVAKNDPKGLWRKISNEVMKGPQGLDPRTAPQPPQSPFSTSPAPGQPTSGPVQTSTTTPGQPAAPGFATMPPGQQTTAPGLATQVQPGQPTVTMPGVQPPRPGGGGETVQNPTAAVKTAAKSKAFEKRPLVDMAKYNLPMSPKQVMGSMYFARLVKSGDYMVGTVKWDKKLLSGASEQTAKNAVIDFVRTKASLAPGGTQDLGWLGRVHLTSYKPGEAHVQFQAEHQGAAPTQVVAPTENAAVEDFES